MRGLATLALLSLCTPACGPTVRDRGGMAWCAKSANTCRCENDTFTLRSDETSVTSCDEPLPGESSCCHDLDVEGLTTTCDCKDYVCYETGTKCECDSWFARTPPAGGMRVASCAERPGSRNCCWGDGFSCICQSHSGTPFQCSVKTAVVSACPSAAEWFRAACNGKVATSCRGLVWRP